MPPEGYYAQLMSKSGLTVLYELEVKAGVIDPDFTSNVGVVLKNNSDQLIECLAGKQIAQLLFIKVATPTLIQVTSLAKTERGEYCVDDSSKDCKYYWILFMMLYCCLHKIFKL